MREVNRVLSGLTLLLCLFIAHRLSAQQFPSELWYDGKLVLLDGDTIEGKIKYDFEIDLVQSIVNNTMQTYSARKILFFQIYDNVSGTYRRFFSLPYKIEPTYKAPILFEALYEGKLSLLCREAIVTESAPAYSYYGFRQPIYATRTKLEFNFYFLDQKGEIEKYMMKKADLLNIMRDKAPQIKQYMKKHNLRHDNRNDLFRIVSYYNALLGK